jgi:DNA-binding NtrC family response regulator
MSERTRNRVLLVDDEAVIRSAIRKFLVAAGFEVTEAENRTTAMSKLRSFRPDAAILDYKLPDGTALDLLPHLRTIDDAMAVIVLTAHATIDLAVTAMKEGADQFLTKPVELPSLLAILQRSLDTHRDLQSDRAGRTKSEKNALNPFTGTSKAVRDLQSDVEKIVGSDRPVLIQGETGTGKGVLANWLHAHSRRRQETFVDLNCAGLSKELLESELFGHERGAFTGAVQPKQGLLDLAHRGTLFLDEIGDIDMQVQPKLLKVLEEKQFRRLGDVKPRFADVRLLAATHHDLAVAVRERRFREDLYFRINTIVLRLPPLRERPEDIPALTGDLLARVAQDMGRPAVMLADSAMRALQEYHWRGNVRELKNVLERSLLLSEGAEIRRADLRFEAQQGGGAAANTQLTLTEVEARHIAAVLKEESGSVEKAAKRLGVTRNTLYYKMRKHGLRG